MRYLLDELLVYEEGYSDILMADSRSARHETFMGAQDLSAPVTQASLIQMQTSLLEAVKSLVHSNPGFYNFKLLIRNTNVST